jgi:hypothetical protein
MAIAYSVLISQKLNSALGSSEDDEGAVWAKNNVLWPEFSAQPRPGQSQVVSNDVNRLAEDLRGFLRGHASQVAHLDEAGEGLIFAVESVESGVHVQQVYLVSRSRRWRFHQRHPLHRFRFRGRIAGALDGATGARIVHEYLPHHTLCDGEKVRAIVKAAVAIAHQFHLRLVDERGRLQGVIGSLPTQVPGRNPMKLVVQRSHNLV